MKIIIKSKKIILLVVVIFIQLVNNNIEGQSWSLDYFLIGDSLVYSISKNNIIQGNSIDFLFPAYKYYQTASKTAIQSEMVGNHEIIELKFISKNIICDKLNFESDMYAEGIDSIQIFFKTIDDHLLPIVQKDILHEYKGYTYLPTIFFSISLINDSIKSIIIVGKSQNKNRKLIIGRLTGSKKIEFKAENMRDVDSLLSKYPIEKQSDSFVYLPDFYHRFHRFGFFSQFVLNECRSVYDSLQNISQFTNKLLNEYELYDIYGIDKHKLINQNILLTKDSHDIDSYYIGMKEIIASLNSCHMRLSTSKQDDVESPLQALYFYSINNNITVSAIFDSTLSNKIQLGDRLLSINHVPLEQLYHKFSKNIYASTPQQREIKITQKLLYLAKEIFGDSLLLEFQNNVNIYSVMLDKSNFSSKKIIPSDFKIISGNVIEKYNKIVYLKPVFQESSLIPYLYSHKADLNNCSGLIIDFRGCTGGDFSFCTFFSFLISKKSLILTSGSNFYNKQYNHDYIIKPSKQININSPIIALIDAKTTCFPELLINALRKIRSDIYVIGATNTAGSAQGAMQINLPNNAVLSYFEGITKDAFGKAIDNNIGVIPDIIINFNSYKDLFPYNDELKRYALKYLDNSIRK